MSIQVDCPVCGHHFVRPDGLAGMSEKCPRCREVLIVPGKNSHFVPPALAKAIRKPAAASPSPPSATGAAGVVETNRHPPAKTERPSAAPAPPVSQPPAAPPRPPESSASAAPPLPVVPPPPSVPPPAPPKVAEVQPSGGSAPADAPLDVGIRMDDVELRP